MTDSAVVNETDVVIVGGGLSGLSAALMLKETGTKFVLLEGKDRLGGRAHSMRSPFGIVDAGAEYIGTLQRTVWHYAQRLGVELFRTEIPSAMGWQFQGADGKVRTFLPGDFPDAQQTMLALGEVDELALLVRPYADRPEDLPDFLKQLDQITIADWTPRSGPLSAATRDAFYASLRAVLSIEPSEASFLFLLHYAATAGGYSSLIDASGSGVGPEDYRFVGGTASLVDAFAAAVGAESIKLGDAVVRIESMPTFAQVTTAAGVVYRAKKVIAALGPWAFRESHKPGIELCFEFDAADAEAGRRACTQRQALCDGMHHGMSLKSFVRFRRPFWRDRNLQGRSLCASSASQPIAWTIDNSSDPSAAPAEEQVHSLLAFMAGDAAHVLLDASVADRKAAVLAQLVALFGEVARDECLDYFDQPMPGPAGVLAKGVLSTVGSALRRPVGRVHWASSESALDWAGYMDGAIQAGLRAATEVL